MSVKSVYKMLPHEIRRARDASSCAFVPVSPCFEWHSYHLPLGTDALIAEGICMCMAERVGGIYFEPLSFGLDEFRPQKQLLAWGFEKDDKIFGMRFPELPLCSEYCNEPEMESAINNRLEAIKGSGFKYAFLVNNHGGTGQTPLLERIAGKWSSDGFKVFYVKTTELSTYRHQLMRAGGHAGQSETLNLMAFHPELVDLTRIPEGELAVREFGILHATPVVEEEFNPRHVLLSVANEIRESILGNFDKFIRENCHFDSK
jgi:creatinine amidohydrolase/Fe(II)-dependent formamide hydrolase-like protein